MKFPTDPQKRNNWIAFFVIVSLPVCCGLAIAGTCLVPPNPEAHIDPEMKEVETSASEMGLIGTILYEKDHRAIASIDLASGIEKEVYRCEGRFEVWAVDGPNRSGVAVVVENDMVGKRHRLMKLNLKDGKSEVMFEREGDALWEDAIDDQVALAENRNLVVLHYGTGHLQLNEPRAYMEVGKQVLLDLDWKKETVIDNSAFSGCAAISADGSRVWLSKPLNREQARKLPGGFKLSKGKEPVPGIYVWIQGLTIPIANGCGFRVYDHVSKCRLFDTDANGLEWDKKSGSVGAFETPNYTYTIEEWLANGTLIASAPQTDPTKVEFVGDNFSRGKQAKVRIVGINPTRGQVRTIVPQIDPTYDKWSYGEWSKLQTRP